MGHLIAGFGDGLDGAPKEAPATDAVDASFAQIGARTYPGCGVELVQLDRRQTTIGQIEIKEFQGMLEADRFATRTGSAIATGNHEMSDPLLMQPCQCEHAQGAQTGDLALAVGIGDAVAGKKGDRLAGEMAVCGRYHNLDRVLRTDGGAKAAAIASLCVQLETIIVQQPRLVRAGLDAGSATRSMAL